MIRSFITHQITPQGDLTKPSINHNLRQQTYGGSDEELRRMTGKTRHRREMGESGK